MIFGDQKANDEANLRTFAIFENSIVQRGTGGQGDAEELLRVFAEFYAKFVVCILCGTHIQRLTSKDSYSEPIIQRLTSRVSCRLEWRSECELECGPPERRTLWLPKRSWILQTTTIHWVDSTHYNPLATWSDHPNTIYTDFLIKFNLNGQSSFCCSSARLQPIVAKLVMPTISWPL